MNANRNIVPIGDLPEGKIEAVTFPGKGDPRYTIGEYGCVSIASYEEAGGGGYAVDWLCVTFEDGRQARVNLKHVELVMLAPEEEIT